MITSKTLNRTYQGIEIYNATRWLNGAWAFGYMVGDSRQFIRHWASAIKSAKRQAAK